MPDVKCSLQGMAERNQAYQPFMQALESKIDGLMGKVKTGEVPESLRHLPKVERPAFKRRKGGGAKSYANKGTYAKTGTYAKKGTSAKKGTKS